MTDARFAGLPQRTLANGLMIIEAATGRARRRGLSGLDELAPEVGFLIPRCRAIQTIEMHFALDLIWLGADAAVVRVDRAVQPRRIRVCRHARSVVEVAAGRADAFVEAGVGRPPTP